MSKNTFFLVFIVSLTICTFFSCGSGDNDNSDDYNNLNKNSFSNEESSEAVTKTGIFIDSPVGGLKYETPTLSGFTDLNGLFKYKKGEIITFFLGKLYLGETIGKEIITPIDIVEDALDEKDAKVTNICRLLQSLDVDGIVDNGIQIIGIIRNEINITEIDLNLASENLDSNVSLQKLFEVLNAIQAFTDGNERRLVGPEKAQMHFKDSLLQISDLPGIVETIDVHIPDIVFDLKTNEPSDRVAGMPTEYADIIDEAVNYLIDDTVNDYEKVKNLHDWIALNIAYDVDSYFTGVFPPMDAESVFERRTAVCSGYSNLFSRFCEIAGVFCEKITGVSKGYGYSSDRTLGEHAWNGVYIDNKWYLIDTTWNAGYLNADEEFIFEYETEYLFANPVAFIYDHYPDHAVWQLLNQPISKNNFEFLTEISGDLFTLGIEFIDPKFLYPNKFSYTVDDEFQIRLKAPEDVDISVSIDSIENEGLVLKQTNNDIQQINVKFPESGEYEVSLKNGYESLLKYRIYANEAAELLFPTVYDSFYEYSLELVDPIEYHVNIDDSFKILLKKPDSTFLVAMLKNSDAEYIDDEHLILSQQDDGVEIYQFKFPGEGFYTISIYIKEMQGGGSYVFKRALDYPVQVNRASDTFFPKFYESFYDYSIDFIGPLEYSYKMEDVFQVELSALEDIVFSTEITSKEDGLIESDDIVSIQESDGFYTFTIEFPESGEYNVVFSANRPGESGYPILGFDLNIVF